MLLENRVVVTGLGVASCTGMDIPTFWHNVSQGISHIGLITRLDTSEMRTKIGGEILDSELESHNIDPKTIKRNSRAVIYALIATNQAVKQANINGAIPPERIASIIGSGIGGMEEVEAQAKILINKSARKVDPLLVPKMICNMSSGIISIEHNLQGPSFAPVSACASGIHSIGEAYWIIKRGDVDAAVCGGTETAITPLSIAGFSSMKAMSTRNDSPKTASRPFTKSRDGFVMAEGAGILVIESLKSAQKRGANILAEIIGYGLSSDANHITAPRPDGQGCVNAIHSALKHASISTDKIDYINAHGTSTPLNDKIETQSIKSVFKEKSYKIPVSSTKSTTGHGIAAAGAWETIICILAINNSLIPPTINYQEPDPECDLDYVPNKARPANINYALNINLGFGGHNAVNIIKKFEE